VLCSSRHTYVYAHIYIHVYGACCVCVYTLLEWTSCPQADQAIERGRVCRTKGGEKGGIERLLIITARPSRLFLFECTEPQMHADILPHRLLRLLSDINTLSYIMHIYVI